MGRGCRRFRDAFEDRRPQTLPAYFHIRAALAAVASRIRSVGRRSQIRRLRLPPKCRSSEPAWAPDSSPTG